MSYHLTILRTSGGRAIPIERAEIDSVCGQDPRWSFDGNEQCLTFVEQGEEVVSLWLGDGTLWARNPEANAHAAMLALARSLDARVRGDELETYRTVDDSYAHPDDAALIAQARRESDRLHGKARVRHLLFRAYQVTTVSFLTFMAVRYLLRQ